MHVCAFTLLKLNGNINNTHKKLSPIKGIMLFELCSCVFALKAKTRLMSSLIATARFTEIKTNGWSLTMPKVKIYKREFACDGL